MADTDNSSSHTRSCKAHLEPVMFLKLRNRWADINLPQFQFINVLKISDFFRALMEFFVSFQKLPFIN